ncbi:fungal-specific transcription factor domain-containing protein [Gymnopilus junonius]|uniref:Fungal-specific transcription factor domain-containing protein n=1 Tax=Gymnopilus junonius TaxID=109634 RepID=A0A9P5NXP0_GYMJU|nr:fungal-specific transcription factor domain-containing protein [Gymnopilus junonius]
MARVWPPSKFGIQRYPHGHTQVDMPPQAVQDQLLDLYFAHIHPVFPVIHKSRFLAEYQSIKQIEGKDFRDSPSLSSAGSAYSSPRPEPTQEVTRLLLFAMFAVAARFTEVDEGSDDDKMWEAGCDYLDSARKILTQVFHISRPSTVQAFLLLGYREFGIGSMEQGWIFIGTGIRMAFDLGLNCDSSKWKMHGHDLFSAEETQTRRQIWWACILTDRYGSVYMGRPLMIKDEDFDTPLPNVDPLEDRQPWQPSVTRDGVSYPSVPCRVMNAFCATSRLAVILGTIVTQIYPVQPLPGGPSRQSMLADLESRLDQWYITLPEELRYDGSPKKLTPPPQILYLHVRYWGAVLLLHRAFIPNWKTYSERPQRSTVGTRAFDLAHRAACHVATIVTNLRETFTMKRSSPFLTSYLLSAAIMHILTLTMRPDNVEASVGLQNCMAALKEMEVVWPSASRAWDLLNGVQLRTHALPPAPALASPQYQPTDRNKRAAQDAFGEEKSSDFLQREAFGTVQPPDESQRDQGLAENNMNGNGVQDISTRLMAHMLGLEVPGVEPSTSYYPGYEWWPRMNQGMNQGYSQPLPAQNPAYPGNAEFPPDMQSMRPGGNTGPNWEQQLHPGVGQQDYGLHQGLTYNYDFGQYGV